jgi:hypothetical protein
MDTARDHIDKSSIPYWRDHPAGASRRRVTENDVINAETLPKVKMPNRDGFISKYPDKH